jgi:hypothetical protein
MVKGKSFYQDGIRFECQGEGNCCVSRGGYGYVYLSFGDRKRLADHFRMSTTEFTAAFTRKVDGLYELRYTGKDCPFLLARKHEQCGMGERSGFLVSRCGQGQAVHGERDRGHHREEKGSLMIHGAWTPPADTGLNVVYY